MDSLLIRGLAIGLVVSVLVGAWMAWDLWRTVKKYDRDTEDE